MLDVGDRIGSYAITKVVNRGGGFCDSFIASKGGKKFFLKMYRDPTEMSRDFKDFYKNQKKIASLLSPLRDCTEHLEEHFVLDGHYYQVKSLLSGKNLANWMEEVLEFEPRRQAAIQLAGILKKVHDVGIVHQDLKPEQVMVESASPLKLVLTDFDWSFPGDSIVRLVGTPWYFHPDDMPSKRSDIFTLGIIICVLLTGSNPYQHNNGGEYKDEREWQRWVQGKKYLEPIALNPDDVTQKLNRMILYCLSPNASERPTLDEIISTLENPSDIPEMIKLECGTEKLLMPVNAVATRKDFKYCFSSVTDSEGNPVYLYISHGAEALKVVLDGEQIALCTPTSMTNSFKVNGKLISDSPVVVKDGDRLDLFSSRKGVVVASFVIHVK